MRFIIAAIVCLGINDLHAQSVFKIEQELLAQFKKIHPLDFDSGYLERYDSLQQANVDFRNSLLKYTSTVHATITFDFNELEKEGLVIKTSEDGLFRIYTWNTWTGGTAHYFDGICQYKEGNKIFSKSLYKEEGDCGRLYSRIYSLKTDDKNLFSSRKTRKTCETNLL